MYVVCRRGTLFVCLMYVVCRRGNVLCTLFVGGVMSYVRCL